jgi:thioredoxin reductase/Fe-S-cluster-containing hydrogenase component 2/bacterioferritin-associated ferredoxin
MASYRIEQHPILPVAPRAGVAFTWQGRELMAREGETIASALFANGVRVFGHHPKDGSPQGIFCANGQCAQCLVLADGMPVKSCMERVRPGMQVEPADGLPELPRMDSVPVLREIAAIEVPVLIIGGGPAGMSAAIQLGQRGIRTLLVDDKHRLGGKLVLQTHRFFGSVNAVYAGTRGIDIATRLEREVRAFDCIEVWLDSTALAVFSDRKVGILKVPEPDVMPHSPAHAGGIRAHEDSHCEGDSPPAPVGPGDSPKQSPPQVTDCFAEGATPRNDGGAGDRTPSYILIKPQVILAAAGAREKSLAFRGNTLPGVYGAGAFQTLVNRDLVAAAKRLFIVGGGNVGLIAGYHALQASIQVVGLVEALPECGGYKVHKDKLARMGVPIYTSHTILSANGTEQVESVTIAQVDRQFKPIPGTEQSFACDTVLIAVGLDPVDEFYRKAQQFDMTVFAAGDAEEIAEASAAMFSGRIKGLEVARALGHDVGEIPPDWYRTAEILRSKPGATIAERIPEEETGVFPVFHCSQEIPCNPCTAVCSQGAIHIDEDDIRALPSFIAEQLGKRCIGCEKCVTICPGLAITLVDYRKDPAQPTVTIPYEFLREGIRPGDVITVLDAAGETLGNVEVSRVRAAKANDRTLAVQVKAPAAYAKRIAGIQIQEEQVTEPTLAPALRSGASAGVDHYVERITDDTVVCRCERVTAAEIRDLIRRGFRDINEIKAVTRAGMGSCGSKTCNALIHRLFRDEGIPAAGVTNGTKRPLFMEVPLGVFAGVTKG